MSNSVEAVAQGSNALGSGITISGLNKTFQIGKETLVALEDATLHSDKGSFISLLGPSGCGKSTILRILAGLETPTSGYVTVDGKDPQVESVEARAAYLAHRPSRPEKHT